jgi:hypothetical protein
MVLQNVSAQQNASSDKLLKVGILTNEKEEDPVFQSTPVDVFMLRHPSFGSFYCGGNGGSITIELDGTCSAEGDIVLMNAGVAVAPAVFEIKCTPFTMIQLFRDSYFMMRSNEGSVLRARIVATNPAFPFVSPANAAQGFTVTASVRLELEPGQTLSPGAYTGAFQTTWITE